MTLAACACARKAGSRTCRPIAAGVAQLMLSLLDLPIERVLVSHGEPVLHDGRAALAQAIAEARED